MNFNGPLSKLGGGAMDIGIVEFTALLVATVVAFLASLSLLFGAGCAGLIVVWRVFKISRSSAK